MGRFSFRLQPLLNIKEQIEEQKEIEYGRALRKLEEERTIMAKMLSQRDELIQAFRASLSDMINPADIRGYNNCLERLKQMIKEQRRRIEAAEVFAEKKRKELMEAMKQRKMMESVRETRLTDHMLNEKLTEQKQVDELVSYQYSPGV